MKKIIFLLLLLFSGCATTKSKLAEDPCFVNKMSCVDQYLFCLDNAVCEE